MYKKYLYNPPIFQSIFQNYVTIVPMDYLFVWSFSPHQRNYHSFGDVTGANLALCSALMTIEQLGFYSVPHLLLHGTYVYNGHLRGHTPNAERNLGLLRLGIEHPKFRLRGERSKSLRHRRGCTDRMYSLKLIKNRIVL